MKTICRNIGLLVGFIVLVFSCVKQDDIYKKPQHTADLEVPEGFDWSSTQTVPLSITSPAATVASFYSDASCGPESQIGVLPVSEGKTTYTFDLPYSQKAIYVKYTLADGTVKTIKSNIQAVSRAVESDDIIFFEPSPNVSNYSLNIPNSGGYGTIMFEDTWPDMGDYDFNDVVINYKMNCKLDTREGDAPVIVVNVSLKIRALGGQFPYDFGMQIGTWGMRGPRIPAEDLVGVALTGRDNDRLNIEVLKTDYPAILVTGLQSLRKNGFYNTVEKEDDGVGIDFTVTLKGSLDDQFQRIYGLADPRAFDYFLRQENGKEIHLMGFAPTSLYTGYDRDVAEKGGAVYYENYKRLVWGLKAPVEIGWPAEKQDITGVYTRFADWVLSGGSLIGDNPNLLVWYDFHTSDNYISAGR